jgi:hypothetical protein
MKGCFKFVVIAFLLLCAVSFGRYYFLLTPEQRAAELARFKAEQRADEEAAERRREESRKDNERIESLKPGFITWLLENTGVTKARFKSGLMGDVIEVEFDRVWTSKDEARVKAEALARAWRLQSGIDYAECAIFWGNEIYATGVSR